MLSQRPPRPGARLESAQRSDLTCSADALTVRVENRAPLPLPLLLVSLLLGSSLLQDFAFVCLHESLFLGAAKHCRLATGFRLLAPELLGSKLGLLFLKLCVVALFVEEMRVRSPRDLQMQKRLNALQTADVPVALRTRMDERGGALIAASARAAFTKGGSADKNLRIKRHSDASCPLRAKVSSSCTNRKGGKPQCNSLKRTGKEKVCAGISEFCSKITSRMIHKCNPR